MKKLLIATVAAVVVASPALAQSQSYRQPAAQPNAQFGFGWTAPERAFAQQPRPGVWAHSSNPAYDAYDLQGNYAGSDPDPLVRDMLERDPRGSDY